VNNGRCARSAVLRSGPVAQSAAPVGPGRGRAPIAHRLPGRPARLRRRPGPGSGPAARHWSRPPDGPAYNCTPGLSAARPAGWPSDGPVRPARRPDYGE